MDINLTTPALLFPALSLLLLAYTNRFLALSALIRNLYSDYKTNPDEIIIKQIRHLRHRVILIRNMQAAGVISIFLCVLCMFLIFGNAMQFAKIIFGLSLLSLMTSLAISFREVQLSVNALNLQISDIEHLVDHASHP